MFRPSLRAHVKELGGAILAYCPAEDREITPGLENLALAPPAPRVSESCTGHRRSRDGGSAAAAMPYGQGRLRPRKLGLFLDGLGSRASQRRPPSSARKWRPSS
jgi:hypothetical protein